MDRYLLTNGPSDEIGGTLIEASNSKGKEQKNHKCSDKIFDASDEPKMTRRLVLMVQSSRGRFLAKKIKVNVSRSHRA